ncbi:uncharacterized protein [Aegilops tauschii subsp. strangulata]|uniref:uncharacterized protein n=1 Tax=Aegilops tauschii subsp. strangulata TaxID=200361 RepID=UPI003CC84976
MDTNPLATPDTSDDDASAPAANAPPPSALAHAPPASAPLSTAPPAPLLAPGAFPSTVLQTIDIRHHVPVTLDLHAGNYAQWRGFFLTIVGMFGVRDHLVAPAAPRRRDPEWVMVDHCVVHWLYSTVSPELLDAVMQPDDTADVLWAAIEGIFRDNNLSRAVYLDAEYHAVVQGDLTVMQYCTRLKSFADQLRDLGQPVSEPQQLFNMLRGLGRQYHTAIPHLTSRVPLPTFLEARSFLLLEEHRAEQAARQQSAHALIAARPPDIRTRLVILRCDSTGDLYPVCCNPAVPRASYFAGVASAELWHSRLGHPGKEVLRRALGQFEFTCAPSTPHSCSACRLGKNTRLPFAVSTSTSYFPFQLLHLDVWTSPVVSISGFEYYLVIIDSCTHYVWTFPLRNKSDVICVLTAFYAYVHTQFERPILTLQTDNGREFDNLAVRSLLCRHGTVLRLSCPYTTNKTGLPSVLSAL